ncbi:MAG TPA: GTPase ObgE, partial [Anaerolineales bacterium]|nr:GTPase ObgE [Anaerolineales bacterium]
MFIDEAMIEIQSGRGGDGIVHFRREKFVPRGGPDGGDGGRGGDVILTVNPRLNTLSNFRYRQQFRAEDGDRGGPNNRTGKSADDLVVAVPPGTVVYDQASGEILADMVGEEQRFTIARGGRGGRGNARFANSRNQAPRIAEKGEPGEEKKVRLELKLIADIGIVGVPNAGKSTFLSVVTNARPKIAAYPFTTLEPNLGVAELDDERSLVLADIPGLIEGAHSGVGLGHNFLRHIQRTRVLIHLLDGMSEDPLLDYAQINSELALFDEKLAEKPQVVALNKNDLPAVQARWPEIKSRLQDRGVTPYAISAVTGQSVREVLYQAVRLLDNLPPPEPVVEMPVYRLEED